MTRDIRAARAYVELMLKDKGFNQKLRAAGERLKKFGSDVTAVGRTLLVGSAALLAPLGLAGQTFADFDDKMREVKAVTQATQEQFVKMTEHSKKLGATTSFTAVQVAALKAELGRAGFNPEQVDEMTAAVLNLSRATSTDATESAGIMAATLRQFNLDAGDSTRVADSLTAAANKSFNTVNSLGESLSYAGPVAADFNMSLEDTLAILGSLGNVGIQGSNAGTAVRRLLTLTGAEAKKLKSIFGVEFLDMAGNARPLVDVLGEVNEATKGLGTGKRSEKFNEAFGLLGITGASAISKNVVSVRELQDAIGGAGGIAADTAREMDAGLGGSLRMMWSAIEGVGIALGNAISGPMTQASDVIQSLAGKVITFVDANGELIRTIAAGAAVVAAIGGGLVALGVTISGVGTLMVGASLGVSALGAMFAALVSPVGIAVAAVGAFVAMLAQSEPVVNAFWTMVTAAWNAISTFSQEVWSFIVEQVTWAWDSMVAITAPAVSWLQEAAITAFNEITFAVNNWRLLLAQGMVKASLAVVTFANQTVYYFTEVIPGYLAWFVRNWREYFTDVWNISTTILGNLGTNIANLWQAIVGVFNGEGFNFEWTPLTEGFESAIRELPEIAERELGPLEKSLTEQLNGIGEELKQRRAEHEAGLNAMKPKAGPKGAASAGPDAPGSPGKAKLTPETARLSPQTGSASKEVVGAFSAASLAAGANSGPQKTNRLLNDLLQEYRMARREARKDRQMNRGVLNA